MDFVNTFGFSFRDLMYRNKVQGTYCVQRVGHFECCYIGNNVIFFCVCEIRYFSLFSRIAFMSACSGGSILGMSICPSISKKLSLHYHLVSRISDNSHSS